MISITIPVTSFAEQQSAIKEDFHEGFIEWILHCNMGRTHASTVRVIDYDMNQDSEKVERFDIVVWTDNEDRLENYPVTETGNNTGIFDTIVFFTHDVESPGHRLTGLPNGTAYAKYVDHTLPNSDNADMIGISVVLELPASGWRDGNMWKITYDPCLIDYSAKNKDSLDWFSIFYPAPLKQIESGLSLHEIKCKNHLELIQRQGGSPACVKSETKAKLIERGWIQEESRCHGCDSVNNSDAIKHYANTTASCNNSAGQPDGECFLNAFKKCESARIKQMIITTEGDPIFSYATIMSENPCSIHFEVDTSQDKYRGIDAKGIMYITCTDMYLEKHAITFQCNDEQYNIRLK